jgi:RimJ/RimL family protein N-acetyltransferase
MTSPVLMAGSAAGVLTLRELHPDDVMQAYVNWMNDPVVTRYTEQCHITHTTESVVRFVKEKSDTPENFLFGIFTEEQHIGNVKLGPVIHHHRRADISFIVGNRNYWGQGVASALVSAVIKFGFDILKLNKICEGCFAENVASMRVFEKLGFTIEARLPRHLVIDDRQVDQILLGRFNEL